MKLIIQNNRVVATATDEYLGPDMFIAAPQGFDIERIGEYVVANDIASLDIQSTVIKAVQVRLDDFAKTRNYDGILSACTYATSGIPKFAAEGQCAVNLRDQTWAALYSFLADVVAGNTPIPSSFSDVEPSLPALAWPI